MGVLRNSDVVRIRFESKIVPGIVVNDMYRFADMYLVEVFCNPPHAHVWFKNGVALTADLRNEIAEVRFEENNADRTSHVEPLVNSDSCAKSPYPIRGVQRHSFLDGFLDKADSTS